MTMQRISIVLSLLLLVYTVTSTVVMHLKLPGSETTATVDCSADNDDNNENEPTCKINNVDDDVDEGRRGRR